MFFVLFAFNIIFGKKSTLSDEELVEEIVHSQNSRLVEVLYERYADKVYRRCISFVKEASIAEDLTHDIFIKVYLNLGRFKQKSKFSTWLYSITYNFCVDYVRKKQKDNVVDMEDKEGEIAGRDIDTADDLDHIALDRLTELLEQLKPEDKLILLMKYRDDMSIKDIQIAFDISESAVKMRIKRAKEKLKSLYCEMYEEIPL
ncbi:MAG: RNA polymerase sigma factor [Chitinophagales bacterium]|jgi:RNA polymerase sigma factor (sigma-70 family)|nr:RNA polymerase sigma factor [Chitinophagales bacterium]